MRLKGRYDGVEDILMNISKYPKELLNLAIKNHETIEFVAGYPKHDKDIEANGRISANELKKRDTFITAVGYQMGICKIRELDDCS